MATEEQIEKRQKALAKIDKKKRKLKSKKKRQAKRSEALKKKLKATGPKQKKQKNRLESKLAKSKKTRKELRKKIKRTRVLRKNKSRIVTQNEADKGEKNPTIDPFMNAEDLMRMTEAKEELANKLNNLDYALESLRIDTEYEKTNIDKSEREGLRSTNEDFASRGLFSSSVRDASLLDVNAQANIAKGQLDRELDAAVLDAQNQKVAAQGAFDSFQSAMNQKKVENARALAPETGVWKRKPKQASATVTRIDKKGKVHTKQKKYGYKPPKKKLPKPVNPQASTNPPAGTANG